MDTIAILEPVPDFFKASLRQLGFQLWEVGEGEFRQNGPKEWKVVGLVIRSKTFVDAELMDVSGALKFVMRPGSGLDNVDRSAANSRHISLITSPEGNCHAVGEHALGMLLSLLHRVPQASNQVKAGLWKREANRGTELRNLTVGIVGYGHTGNAFAQKLKGFGCQILAYDKFEAINDDSNSVEPSDPAYLFRHADVISFHVPYNADTHHYFNESKLDNRRKPLILINTARGSVVKSEALLKGLKDGTIKGACLDVLETEDSDVPDENVKEATEALKGREDVLITPHIAGWSYYSEKAIYKGLLEKLKDLYD